MPLRILKESVTVFRDGKHVRLKPGQEFEFNQTEIDEIEGTADKEGSRPQALAKKTVEVADKPVVKPAVKPVAPVAPVEKPGDDKAGDL